MRAQAAEWLRAHPADMWRLRASVRTNPMSGVYEDDLERFFHRPAHKISSADIYRWRAACDALRELTGENRKG